MAEEINKQTQAATKNEDFEKIQEWLYLCLSRWYWFALSLIIALGLALLYLMVTTPSYTRMMSVLIKDEDKNRSLSSEFSQFSDMGFGVGKTNLYNEMITLKSPSYMEDVVRDLHLDFDYRTEGRFHELALYGKTLPVVVSLPDIDADEWASFTLMIKNDNTIQMTDFMDSNMDAPSAAVVKGTLGEVCGRFIIENSTLLKLEEIQDGSQFEYFDYKEN